MTDQTRPLFNHLSTTSDFILAKTDASCFGVPTRLDTSPATPDSPPQALLELFPDLTMGRRFLENAMESLSSVDLFCACAIRIGSTDMALESEDGPGSSLPVAKAIDIACLENNGFWGMIDQDLFGCFFPGKSETFCEKAVALIRKGLPGNNRPNVTIGTAVYPTLSFEKKETLENACKAVDHACFFGPDSTIPFDDVSLNISGDKLFQNGNIDAAVREFNAALQLNPKNINVRNSLGVCYGLLGRLDLAKQEFAAAICCNGLEVMTLYNLGLVHMLLADREKALDYFQKALKLNDDIFEVTFQTGQLLLEMGETETSRPYIDRAIQLDPSSSQAYRVLGDYYLARDLLSDAIGAYKKAIKLNPNDAAALSALGGVYDLRDENTEIATLYCEKSVQLSPEEGLFHLRLGKLYLKQDRVNEAQLSFKTAADLGQNTQNLIEDEARSRKTG